MERKWLLAIDTSTDWSGVALTDGNSWAELNWSAGRHQTTQVLPEIERLLVRMSVSMGDVGAIAVAIGPGSFSGLRVGLSLAKGFALAEEVALIGVSTLEVTVHGWDDELPVVGVVRAGRRRYVWAERSALTDLQTGEIDALVGATPPGATVVGEIDDAGAAALIANGRSVPGEPLRTRRAASLAAIGSARWRAGEVDDSARLEPLYIHPT
jgi:tRNA threonylcarbamoyladenosine biosynthesis protein TsaB